MFINFDIEPSQFVLMKIDDDKRRWYYASGEPRVVLRLDGFAIEDIQPGEWCDGLVGWDRGDAGYVLPAHVGAKHTKITLKSHGVKEFSINTPPADLKMLSAILAEAPRQIVKFDAAQIADETISWLTEHVTRLSHKLSIGGWHPGVAPDRDFVPLRAEIEDLCRIANGEIDRATASEELVGETNELIQDIAELCAWWWTAEYQIPQSWRETDLGRAWDAARFWLLSDDMMTLSDAAAQMGYAADSTGLSRIDRLIERGKLSIYIDPSESNPRRARRVSKREVKALKRSAKK
jgi:hypothetical protein